MAAGALLGLAAAVESVLRNAGTDAVGPFVLLVSLVGLATTLPVALRPTAAAVAVTVAAVGSLAVFQALTGAGAAAQLVAAYRLGRGGWPPLAAPLGVPYVLVLAFGPAAGTGVRVLATVLACLVPVAATIGTARRTRREDAESRAAHRAIAGTLLEHTARGERARIARELHDVVAHHISMISVQAENARLTTPGLPASGAARLSAIGDTARAALTEMRRLLGVLREDAQADAARRQPQPGLRELTELLDQARDTSGAGTRLILRGAPRALDPGVELAVYRIVQEALTNSRRHAPGAAVDVELHYTDAALRLLIRDNGPGPAASGRPAGHGLLGMRERAAAVGGRLRAGAGAGGGFLVESTLPTRAGEDARRHPAPAAGTPSGTDVP
ncbi:sensor histidine kinase [Frankia sp. CNm7]|nr:sensor histidine kinase [Frankia nepalensis]MBL7510011.1 sensor histidine kinase [Frankia nepalensis]MBL7517139.1 sensor histidine kinase [Frankia nepalensis]